MNKASSRWVIGFSSPEVEKSVKARENINTKRPATAAAGARATPQIAMPSAVMVTTVDTIIRVRKAS